MRNVLVLCVFCISLSGIETKYEARVKVYKIDEDLSDVDYKDKVLQSRNAVESVLHCAILCRNSDKCLSYSYNTLNKTCTTYSVIFCDKNQAKGGFVENNNYYVAGKIGKFI